MANTKRQQDEKTKLFKKHFVSERESGLSIPEIADKYHISRRHAYNLLQEIADENGVTRKSLLQQPNKQHTTPLFTNTRNNEEKINVEKVREDFQNILTAAENVMNAIETLLEEDVQWVI